MVFSFVILSYNSIDTIKRSLDAILTTMSVLDETFEVLIVDNGSSDNTVDILRQYDTLHPGKFDVMLLEENQGTTRSRNYALRKASGDYIVIMDSDTYINSNALSVLSAHLRHNPNCGLAVPAVSYDDGRHQISTDQFPTLVRKITRLLFLKRIEDASRRTLQHGGCVDYAISAFWMMPSSILKNVGLFDERIFYSPEDVDFCIRIWKAGLSVEQNIDANVIHDAQEISRPSNPFKFNRFTFSHIGGMFYIFRKHRYMLRSPKISK